MLKELTSGFREQMNRPRAGFNLQYLQAPENLIFVLIFIGNNYLAFTHGYFKRQMAHSKSYSMNIYTIKPCLFIVEVNEAVKRT